MKGVGGGVPSKHLLVRSPRLISARSRGAMATRQACELQLTAPGADAAAEGVAVVPVPADRVALARIRACHEDVLYCWALAEAYCGHAGLRRDMRCACLRPPVARDQLGVINCLATASLRRTPRLAVTPGLIAPQGGVGAGSRAGAAGRGT